MFSFSLLRPITLYINQNPSTSQGAHQLYKYNYLDRNNPKELNKIKHFQVEKFLSVIIQSSKKWEKFSPRSNSIHFNLLVISPYIHRGKVVAIKCIINLLIQYYNHFNHPYYLNRNRGSLIHGIDHRTLTRIYDSPWCTLPRPRLSANGRTFVSAKYH